MNWSERLKRCTSSETRIRIVRCVRKESERKRRSENDDLIGREGGKLARKMEEIFTSGERRRGKGVYESVGAWALRSSW